MFTKIECPDCGLHIVLHLGVHDAVTLTAVRSAKPYVKEYFRLQEWYRDYVLPKVAELASQGEVHIDVLREIIDCDEKLFYEVVESLKRDLDLYEKKEGILAPISGGMYG